MTMIMVLPSEWMRLSSSITTFELRLSRLPVGSSARIISGLLTKDLAIQARCFCPPES